MPNDSPSRRTYSQFAAKSTAAENAEGSSEPATLRSSLRPPTNQPRLHAQHWVRNVGRSITNSEVRFQNSGFLVHQIQGIGVKNAKAAKHLTALLLAGNDNEAQKVGISAPEFAGPLSPGGAQQELINERPGVYLLVCIMRTQDGREHTQLGMERTIKIVR